MPHEKFYDYNKWEMKRYQEEQTKARKRKLEDDDGGFFQGQRLSDEEVKRLEMKMQKKELKAREFEVLKERMQQDASHRESMRRQEQLRGELQLAYKAGDMEAVRRLERILAPSKGKEADEDEDM